MAEKWFSESNLHDSNRASIEWVSACLRAGCKAAENSSKGPICNKFSPGLVRGKFEGEMGCDSAVVGGKTGTMTWNGFEESSS